MKSVRWKTIVLATLSVSLCSTDAASQVLRCEISINATQGLDEAAALQRPAKPGVIVLLPLT